MLNDDGLKEALEDKLLPIGDSQINEWLSELLDAREKIAAMQHGMKFYIERNIELTQEASDAKTNLEYWVTQAGLAEAKIGELEKCYADALGDCNTLRDQIREMRETKDK